MSRPLAAPDGSGSHSNLAPSTCPDAPPPWTLHGEAIVLPLLSFNGGRLKIGARMWVRYDSSPVGPYDEYAVAILARTGNLWGPRVVEMAVSSPDSMRCGRANWGFPKIVRSLKYLRRGLGVRFQDAGRSKSFRLSRWSIPVAAPAWCVQVLERTLVRVPMKIRGRARLCWSGRALGVCVEEFEFFVAPPAR